MNIKEIMKQKKAKSNEDRLKEYLHSYLAWLYYQNHNFFETLKTEELVNYLMTKVEHDDWFNQYINSNPLEYVAHIFEFIDNYKREANMFHYTMIITPKLHGPYREVELHVQ